MPKVDLTITSQPPEAPRPAPDLTTSIRDIRVDVEPAAAEDTESEDE